MSTESRDRLVIISGCGSLAVCLPLSVEYSVFWDRAGQHESAQRLVLIRRGVEASTLHPGKHRSYQDAVVLIAQALANPPASGVLDLREP